ncbi:ribosomal protein S10 domain-containing protein [Syncephalis pseudoplumigaleata]|uniref:Small ribosomal subunit protein uS10m n=1 Tax=Syncephalis pseudoplumigaleata TaxID=1712513 RepID=A0A4P9Z2I2_9FUNG|nr:ribosomal protein S10 domain-containing protein [Syncephalis pseudoplumigaleata]|eukprot:RKP26606.1 ribosomal protein S10 domain-containing protein [Syncephalis pseudoplumigaleata]
MCARLFICFPLLAFFSLSLPLSTIMSLSPLLRRPEIDAIYYEPERVPPTHGHVVCNLHFRSFSPNVMDFYTDFTRRAAAAFGIPCSGTVFLPTKTEKWTVLRSPFVHKKAQENFERKHHKRLLQLKDASPETIARLLAYIERTCPAGIGVKVTTWEHESLGQKQKQKQ